MTLNFVLRHSFVTRIHILNFTLQNLIKETIPEKIAVSHNAQFNAKGFGASGEMINGKTLKERDEVRKKTKSGDQPSDRWEVARSTPRRRNSAAIFFGGISSFFIIFHEITLVKIRTLV